MNENILKKLDKLEKILGEVIANMLTKKEAENFATKDDLANFATKADLSNFATKDDLANFATKADLSNFATKDDLLAAEERILVGLTGTIREVGDHIFERKANNEDVEQLKVRVDKLERKVHIN